MARKKSLLPPKVKKNAAMAGLAGLLVLVAAGALLLSERREKSHAEGTVRNVLLDRNTREVSLDAIESSLKKLTRENKELARQVAGLQEQLERQAYRTGLKIDPSALDTRLSAMSRQLAALDEKYRHLTSENGMEYLRSKHDAAQVRQERQFSDSSVPQSAGRGAGSKPAVSCREGEMPADGRCVKKPQKPSEPPTGRPEDQYFRESSVRPSEGRRRIGVYTAGKESAVSKVETQETPRTPESRGLFLPAGSILSGVFINGMDAPTGQGAGKDHFPALIRIRKEAILPNRYRADIRECFLIVSGYGDLSSERAYLRGELLSCITEDRKIIEGQLDAYVVGNDGFAGVRGRLVSKQGQIIAKSLMSGFLSGLAGAFDVKPVPTISTSSNGTVSYESIYSSKALQGAAATGISTSLGKVADFYLKLAESLYPVIEISAGRQVDVVVSKGAYLEAVAPGQSGMRSAVSEARRQRDQMAGGRTGHTAEGSKK